MGIFGELGNSIKKGIKNISDNIDKGQEIIRTKRQILSRYEMNDLRKICKDYGIGEPLSYEEDILTGDKHKRIVTREHFVNRVINKLTLDQIKTFSDKNKIKIWDILKEEKPMITEISKVEKVKDIQEEPEQKVTTIEVKRQSEFDAILEDIEKNFQIVDNVHDESDFKKQLAQFLINRYNNRLSIESPNPKGRTDILINNKYLLELKIAKQKEQLRNLIGQINDYKKVYTNLAVILLDVGEMTSLEIKERLEDYELHGAKTVVVGGKLHRKKGRTRQIIIRG